MSLLTHPVVVMTCEMCISKLCAVALPVPWMRDCSHRPGPHRHPLMSQKRWQRMPRTELLWRLSLCLISAWFRYHPASVLLMSLETAAENISVTCKGMKPFVKLSKMDFNTKFWDTSLIFQHGINRDHISSRRLISGEYGWGRPVKLMEDRI